VVIEHGYQHMVHYNGNTIRTGTIGVIDMVTENIIP